MSISEKGGIYDEEAKTPIIVSVLTLNRPKANAMGKVMISQLKESLNELERYYDNGNSDNETTTIIEGEKNPIVVSLKQNPPRCLVITSFSDKVFSAGADLKERRSMSIDDTSIFVTDLRNTFYRIHQLPIPVIASIHGIAVGGGMELALAADIRVANNNATFGLPETSLGIVPGAGGTQYLSRIVGIGRAKELIFTGRRFNGIQAEQYGLVQYTVDPETDVINHTDNNGSGSTTIPAMRNATDRVALDLAWTIASNGPIAIRQSKAAIQKGIEAPSLYDGLEIERTSYNGILTTQDRLEGLRAFQEKRKPNYKGH